MRDSSIVFSFVLYLKISFPRSQRKRAVMADLNGCVSRDNDQL